MIVECLCVNKNGSSITPPYEVKGVSEGRVILQCPNCGDIKLKKIVYNPSGDVVLI